MPVSSHRSFTRRSTTRRRRSLISPPPATFFSNSNFRYVGEWTGDNSAVLEFEAVLDGISINGVDIIKWNAAGAISNFKVMVRPLKAIDLLHRKMAEILARGRTT